MITHDQFGKECPRADLIRFKSLGEALRKHSIDVVYVASNERARFEESFYKGAKVYKIPFVTRIRIIQVVCFYLFLFPVLVRIRQHGRFHIIFINSIFMVPYALMFKWISGNGRIQLDIMGILTEEKFLGSPKNFWLIAAKKVFSSIENYLSSRVDFITTINNQHRQILLKRTPRPVYVIRDGVFEDILKHEKPINMDFVNPQKLILIFVGQVNHFRLDQLLKVLPELIFELPTLHLEVLGEGPQLERYKRIVQSLGMESRVTFYGHVPHERIFDYIAAADIAYSDDWSINGFPMKLFDYMAMGKAIVAEGTESVKELLTDQLNALLYTNKAELKEKILKLAKDPALREKIGKAAKGMMDQYTWEQRVKILESIYHEYLSK
jgi:glycosyltransferase involved in cell wall biosynthesis